MDSAKSLEERITALAETFAYKRFVDSWEELQKDPQSQEKNRAFVRSYNAVSKLFFKQIEFHCRAAFKPSSPANELSLLRETSTFTKKSLQEAFIIAAEEIPLFSKIHRRLQEAKGKKQQFKNA